MEWKTLAPGAAYFYYPRLVCVVGIWDEAKATTNFVPVTWSTPLSSRPPLYGICLSPRTYSHQLLLRTGEFTLSFLQLDQASIVDQLGSTSGRDVDKVKVFDLKLVESELVRTPFLAGSYAAAECRLLRRESVGDQSLFVGEVLRLAVQREVFGEDGVVRLHRVTPLLYLGANHYAAPDPESVRKLR